ncbi:MAG: polysaccharide deacetylase family protein [Candidatus Omnitrophica bacterium]|nr:polysaccharide deacetylase family protein [Candidatus Omnitrophota bacterium]MBU1923218.1 polysaccharide deacetylase family protein [Candidatus Omnitrophota bacterium]
MKKIPIILFVIIVLSGAFYFFWFFPRYTVPILVYHSIDYKEESPFVVPENFIKQLEYIKRKGYEVITLDELVESIKSKKQLKRNKVVITFDDGYKNNFKYAYPILKRFGFPATVFLISDYMGNDKRFLSWEQVRIMFKDNISFGAHTKTHFYLGVVEDEKVALEEIVGSKKKIEQEIGMAVDYFCYPGGGFNERVKEIVKQAGYKGACATNRGFAGFNRDVYELKRIKVNNSDMDKPFSFWMKLSGYYNLVRSKKNPY